MEALTPGDPANGAQVRGACSVLPEANTANLGIRTVEGTRSNLLTSGEAQSHGVFSLVPRAIVGQCENMAAVLGPLALKCPFATVET